jgi:hypothetical protein
MRVVRRGDTLYGIAQRLGTDVHTLAQPMACDPAIGCMRVRICGSRASTPAPFSKLA